MMMAVGCPQPCRGAKQGGRGQKSVVADQENCRSVRYIYKKILIYYIYMCIYMYIMYIYYIDTLSIYKNTN